MKLSSTYFIGIIAVLTLLTNILGFGREILFASKLGVSDEADSFIAAYALIAACFLVFTASTVQATFMPRFQVLKERSAKQGVLFFQNTFLYIFIITTVLSLVIFLFSDTWVGLVVPGFEGDKAELTSHILKLLAPIVVFMSTGVLLQSVCHAKNKFVAPAMIPLLGNVVIIASLLVLVPSLGMVGLVVGYLIGALLWWSLALVLRNDIFASRFSLLDKTEMAGLFFATLPLIWLLAADQASALIQKTLVSDLETGSIATLNYAARLSGLPLGIFAAAIATVFFPILSKAHINNNQDNLGKNFRQGLIATAFAMMPLSIFFVWGAETLVQTAFQRGAFDEVATQRTSTALIFYALGMFPQALIVYLNRVFFASGNTRTPMMVGLISVVIHLVANVVLVQKIGYLGIAVGTTIYAIVYAALLLVNLHKAKIDEVYYALKSLWRVVVAAILASIWLPFFPSTGIVDLIMKGALAGTCYIIILVIFGESLLRPLKQSVTKSQASDTGLE